MGLFCNYVVSLYDVFQELVLEKETRVRESMLMMGLQQWILWSTWYLKQFVFLLISAFIMTIFIKVCKTNEYSSTMTHLIFYLSSLVCSPKVTSS